MKFIHPKKYLRAIVNNGKMEQLLSHIRLLKVHFNYASHITRLRRRIKQGSVIRVVFYTNEPQKWSYESLYREFEKSPYFDPVVIVVPRYMVHIGRDNTRMSLEEQYAFYKERGYNVKYGYENGRYLSIQSFEPDLFFYLQLAEVPGVDDPVIVSKRALLCYSPYSFSLTCFSKEYLQRFHRFLFRYYVVHESTRKRFEDYRKGNARNCVTVGYPKLDVYLSERQINPSDYWKEPQKFRVIYAPHHTVSDDVYHFSTFAYNCHFILNLAKSSDSTWIFKPHPMLRRAIVLAGLMTEKEIGDYYQSWSEIGRVYDQGDYFDVFRSSDLMITDCSSILAEYLPSTHPLIRLINEQSCPLDEVGNILSRGFYNVHDNEELERVFKELAVYGNDPMKEKRAEVSKMLIDSNETAAHKVLCDLLKALSIQN